MPGISHEGKKGRCCCCRRCDPPDGRKNGKGGSPLEPLLKATRVGEPGEMLQRTASTQFGNKVTVSSVNSDTSM